MPADDRSADPPAAPPRPDDRADPLAGLRLDPPTWTERIEQLVGPLGARPSPRLLLAGLVALAVVAVGGWLLLARRPPPPLEDTLPTAPTAGAPASTVAPPTTAGRIVAHAAGAVVAPGVYELDVGARVADLVAAAGGLAPDADADRLNLAGPVADGSRVYVPRVGEDVPPEVAAEAPPAAPGEAGGSGGGGPAGGRGRALVDLNEAGIDELDTLPGIGPATAQAIVDHREQHGPFASVDELIDVRGIGEAKLAQLRDLVTV